MVMTNAAVAGELGACEFLTKPVDFDLLSVRGRQPTIAVLAVAAAQDI